MNRVSKVISTAVGVSLLIALPWSFDLGAFTEGQGFDEILVENAACAGTTCPDKGCEGGWTGCALLPDGTLCLTKEE